MTVSKTCMHNQNVITAGEIEKRWSSTFFESRCLRSGKWKVHADIQSVKNYLQWFEKTRIAEVVVYTFQSVCDIVTGDYRYMYFVHKLFSFPKGISNWCVLFLLWHFKSYLAVCILVCILIFYNSILNF